MKTIIILRDNSDIERPITSVWSVNRKNYNFYKEYNEFLFKKYRENNIPAILKKDSQIEFIRAESRQLDKMYEINASWTRENFLDQIANADEVDYIED